ncbi:MAG: hypothetical protein BGO49_20970 [Planctomycetales bacterium 71-10]|nr:MAG: hypothetical protein BGO49_20970 [Planctomycetales bacterium 71-10]
MRHHFGARIKTATAVAPALLLFAPALRGQDAPLAAKADPPRKEIVSGVIVKMEKVARPDGAGAKAPEPRRIRLTINTNVVWRDWARDQAKARDEGSPKADADRGAKSVGTLGPPVDEDSVEVIEVVDATKVETRFRSPADETTEGETKPEKVKSDEGAPAKPPAGGKPVEFRAEDLLPGLFVEAESAKPGGPEAANVAVIRPIQPPEAAQPAEAAPK